MDSRLMDRLAGVEYALVVMLEAFRDRAQLSSELVAVSVGDSALNALRQIRKEYNHAP